MIGQMKSALLAGSIIAGFCAAAGVPAAAAELDGNALLNADKDPNNWVMYHQSYKSWHYSPLDQINTANVSKLQRIRGLKAPVQYGDPSEKRSRAAM